jgi:SAM-dependent methyltransferase
VTTSAKERSGSRRTLRFYERFAHEYILQVSPRPPAAVATALRRMVRCVAPPGLVLEIGSGPGRDADFVESLGVAVRRTDPTRAFRDMQAARGKSVERLNLLHDPLGGPYDAILAMCVLIHIERGRTDRVLRKVRNALRPGGAFLVSVWEGTGESAGAYHMTYWTRDALITRLEAVGLAVEWDSRRVDSDGDRCLTFLARRTA